MKKIFFCFFLSLAVLSFGQEKFALVIGNGAYTGLSPLANPVNDAEDMAAMLQSMGFTVEKLLDASLEQMENGIIRLKNRLSVSRDSYGFFFFAGHGVQSNGVNYLIPVGANIPSENFIRDRAVSVQTMLSELNDAKNKLNVVVLDACRDNPFGWARSASRGLTTVSHQPADSIIVFATSAGSTAADGTGRNGLFTTQLLKHMGTPGLEVSELFRRTGADVSQSSNRRQIPAIYNQFFDLAYLGTAPANVPAVNVPVQPVPVQPQPAQPAINPTAARTHFERGERFRERDRWDDAIREYTESIRLDPSQAVYFFYRGWVYDDKEDYVRAIADLNEAIRLNPNDAYSYYIRGIIYSNSGDDNRAIEDYTTAIRLDPNFYNAYNNRGIIYENRRDYDRALADYSAAIRINPDFAEAYQNRGDVYMARGDRTRANADYAKARQLGYRP